VKFIAAEKGSFVFQISKREKRLLFVVLKLYPLIPAAHHRISKTATEKHVKEYQKLLDEALAERKRENKRQLLAMLQEESRFKEADGGYRFTLTAPQTEWLLQVLNDIRVGSWLVLGEPDEKKRKSPELNSENAIYYAAMEFCGYFQMSMLDAFERGG